MLPVILTTLAAAAIAAIVYLRRERVGAAGAGLAALRTTGLAALLLAFFNPTTTSRIAGGAPTVLLDGSLSMGAAGAHGDVARDTAMALAVGGTLLSFGSGVERYDTSRAPMAGHSRLGDALRATTGRSGPITVVTDGEIDDIHAIPSSLLGGVSVVVVPRDTLPNAALLDVEIDSFVAQGDTAHVTLTIGTWGALSGIDASIRVLVSERLIHRQAVTLPESPGTGQRSVSIPSSALAAGTSVLRFILDVSGDAELRDNERLRVLTVTTEPGVVVIVDPADAEGRFLARELRGIVRSGLRGFARVGNDEWLEMGELSRVSANDVRRAINGAAMVVMRGGSPWDGTIPSWHWPAGADGETQFFEGDWYVTDSVPASPIAGRLASIAWDSFPPLTGIVPLVPTAVQWVGLTGRVGRRGADRPLLIGEDSSGVRRLTTAGAGMWRWALRGGSSLDAYRAVLASGIDWLLDSDNAPTAARIAAANAVTRGRPATFRRLSSEVADSLDVVLAGTDSTSRLVLEFDASGEARIDLDPGVYRWSVPSMSDAGGVIAVEAYSDEFHARTVGLQARVATGGFSVLVRYARERWWLFGLAALALIGEWAWRQRIGLP